MACGRYVELNPLKEQGAFSSSVEIIGSAHFKDKLILESGRLVHRGKGRPMKTLNLQDA